MGFVELYSDKTAMKLKAKAFTAHLVHAMLLNFSLHWRSWIFSSADTVVVLLAFCKVETPERFDVDDDTSSN